MSTRVESGKLTMPPCPKCGEKAIRTHLMGWTQEAGHDHDPNLKLCPNGHSFKVKCPIQGCAGESR